MSNLDDIFDEFFSTTKPKKEEGKGKEKKETKKKEKEKRKKTQKEVEIKSTEKKKGERAIEVGDVFDGVKTQQETKPKSKPEKTKVKVEEKEKDKKVTQTKQQVSVDNILGTMPIQTQPAVQGQKQMELPVSRGSKSTSVDEFTFEEMEAQPKEVWLIYGLKGHGKTYLAMTFPGKVAVISFDMKGANVKKYCFGGDERIKVFYALKYARYPEEGITANVKATTAEEYLASMEVTYRYIHALLDYIAEKVKPDWIVIDGVEEFQKVCEMVMRFRNNLGPFQGIANLNLWKERNMYIRMVHDKALAIAKRGLIYTTYTDKDEIIVNGEFILKKDVPKWVDVIMKETDVVVRVRAFTEADNVGRKYIAIIESSKIWIPSGIEVDITDRGYPAIEEEAKRRLEAMKKARVS